VCPCISNKNERWPPVFNKSRKSSTVCKLRLCNFIHVAGIDSQNGHQFWISPPPVRRESAAHLASRPTGMMLITVGGGWSWPFNCIQDTHRERVELHFNCSIRFTQRCLGTDSTTYLPVAVIFFLAGTVQDCGTGSRLHMNKRRYYKGTCSGHRKGFLWHPHDTKKQITRSSPWKA